MISRAASRAVSRAFSRAISQTTSQRVASGAIYQTISHRSISRVASRTEYQTMSQKSGILYDKPAESPVEPYIRQLVPEQQSSRVSQAREMVQAKQDRNNKQK